MLLMLWCCWCADASVADKIQIGVGAHLGTAWSSEFRTVVQRLVFIFSFQFDYHPLSISLSFAFIILHFHFNFTFLSFSFSPLHFHFPFLSPPLSLSLSFTFVFIIRPWIQFGVFLHERSATHWAELSWEKWAASINIVLIATIPILIVISITTIDSNVHQHHF